MFKRIILYTVLITAVMCAAGAAACAWAPAGGGKELSFNPLTYTNDQYGFSLQYPDNFKEDKSKEKGSMVFNAVGPLVGGRIPVLTVNIFDSGRAHEQAIDLIKAGSGSDIKITPLKEITLQDGKTIGRISTTAWYHNDAKFDMRGLSLGVVRGDYQVTVTLTSIFAMYNEDKYMEILNTFTLK
jgi:hypothetical protein